ncbi:MAG: pesticidal protein Cry7Aa [Bacteroidaceae bacterium]
MLTVKREGILLETTHLTFENESVMNPAVIVDHEKVHLLYRAVSEGNHSSIGYCRLGGPMTVVQRNKAPLLFPEFEYESHGVEDPRIVRIENTYYITYTAYDGLNAMGALVESEDLKHFKKKGTITSRFTYEQFKERALQEENQKNRALRSYNERESVSDTGKPLYLTDKDLVFFPRKINGQFFFLHRIKPDIQWAKVDRLEELTYDFWDNYFMHFTRYRLMEPQHSHESSYIGAGCPPLEFPEGWLLIYHSVHKTEKGYTYCACAALLDLHDPTLELARLPYPLFSPEEAYETTGIVNQVCFPTGAALFNDTLYIYYGAADKCIACVSISAQELIHELISYKK